MPITPQSLVIDPRGVEYEILILDADESQATAYTDLNGETEFAFPVSISEPTTFFFTEGVVGQARNATAWTVSALFNGVECASVAGPANVESQNWQPGVLVIDLGNGSEEIASLLTSTHLPLTPVDEGTPETVWFTVTQGETTSTSLGGSYFKGSARQIEVGAFMVDGWGKIDFTGFTGSDDPLVIDFAPFLALFDLGNTIRGIDDMPLGHAGGTIGGAPAPYLHMSYSPDDGACAVRLVDLAAVELATAVVGPGDILHFQFSITTWDD